MAKSSKNWSYDLEEHPFGGPYIPEGVTHLIIGTFPTRRKRRLFEFYYSGQGNMFWQIMSKVFRQDFDHDLKAKATKERKDFLDHRKIGIIDMHKLCYRKDNKSLDHNLYPVLLTDLHSILDKYPTVKDLIFTSRTDGVGAFGLFNNYLVQKGKQGLELDTDETDGLKFGDYSYNEKTYDIWVPYSPSESSEESKKLGVDGLAKMYKKCFNKIAPK